MNNKISHTGIVEAIEGNHIRVRIMQATACSGCKVASHCNASESKEKIVDVYSGIDGLAIGQEVVVSTPLKTAWFSLMIGFILPLAIMLLIVLGCSIAHLSESLIALLAVGSLIPYYIIVWLSRTKIDSKVAFSIERTK